MLKAFNTFKVDTGNKFATYAIRIMENEIRMFLRKKDPIRYATSIDEPISTNHKDGSELTIMDTLEDDSESVEDRVGDKAIIEFIIQQGKSFLSEKEYFVIMNFLNNGSIKQKEIAEKLNVSQASVSRLFNRAINKIRSAIEDGNIPKKQTFKAKEKKKVTAKPKIPVINGKTLYEKIKYVYDHHPELSYKEASELPECNINSVKAYCSQIRKAKREQEERTAPDITIETEPTTSEEKIESPTERSLALNNISLSLKNAPTLYIQDILENILRLLQENDTYNLSIDISKN